MSGAFVKFKGLKNPKSYIKSEPFYSGIPCLYEKHSGQDGSLRVTRDSHTHACVECLETIAQGYFSLDINRLAIKYQARAYKFWSKVDIGEWDECWRWTADPIANQLYHVWPRDEIKSRWGHHPIQVMMWLTWGDTGRLGSTSLCGERRCMNPLHNLPLDIRHSARIEDYDEEWLKNELSKFKQQLLTHEEDKLAKEIAYQTKKLSSKAFDPTTNSKAVDFDSDLNRPPSRYEMAFAQMLQSINDGTHSTYLDEK